MSCASLTTPLAPSRNQAGSGRATGLREEPDEAAIDLAGLLETADGARRRHVQRLEDVARQIRGERLAAHDFDDPRGNPVVGIVVVPVALRDC